MASLSGSPQLGQCAYPLISGFVQCLIKLAAYQEDSIIQYLPIIQEAWKCLTVLFTASSDANSETIYHINLNNIDKFLESQVLAFILPVMILYLQPESKTLAYIHQQTLTSILSFASASPATFKHITSKLEGESRDILEISVKQALGSTKAVLSEASKPQISLRAF